MGNCNTFVSCIDSLTLPIVIPSCHVFRIVERDHRPVEIGKKLRQRKIGGASLSLIARQFLTLNPPKNLRRENVQLLRHVSNGVIDFFAISLQTTLNILGDFSFEI